MRFRMQQLLQKTSSYIAQVWDSSYNQYKLYPSDNPDIEEYMGWEERMRGDPHFVPVETPQALEALPMITYRYKRLEQYINSVTNEDS